MIKWITALVISFILWGIILWIFISWWTNID